MSYPSQEELTKVINLCYNAVNNSAIGPIKKPLIVTPYIHRPATEEEMHNSLDLNRDEKDKVYVGNDALAGNIFNCLVNNLCPKATNIHKNIDGDKKW